MTDLIIVLQGQHDSSQTPPSPLSGAPSFVGSPTLLPPLHLAAAGGPLAFFAAQHQAQQQQQQQHQSAQQQQLSMESFFDSQRPVLALGPSTPPVQSPLQEILQRTMRMQQLQQQQQQQQQHSQQVQDHEQHQHQHNTNMSSPSTHSPTLDLANLMATVSAATAQAANIELDEPVGKDVDQQDVSCDEPMPVLSAIHDEQHESDSKPTSASSAGSPQASVSGVGSPLKPLTHDEHHDGQREHDNVRGVSQVDSGADARDSDAQPMDSTASGDDSLTKNIVNIPTDDQQQCDQEAHCEVAQDEEEEEELEEDEKGAERQRSASAAYAQLMEKLLEAGLFNNFVPQLAPTPTAD